MKISSFRYLVHQGVAGIWKNRMMTFASFCILLVSLLMVGLASLTAINLTRIISGIEDKSEVVVVISDNADKAAEAELEEHLKAIPNVNSIELYSKEEAWNGMLESMTEEERAAALESIVAEEEPASRYLQTDCKGYRTDERDHSTDRNTGFR